jgi:hypothetical protein
MACWWNLEYFLLVVFNSLQWEECFSHMYTHIETRIDYICEKHSSHWKLLKTTNMYSPHFILRAFLSFQVLSTNHPALCQSSASVAIYRDFPCSLHLSLLPDCLLIDFWGSIPSCLASSLRPANNFHRDLGESCILLVTFIAHNCGRCCSSRLILKISFCLAFLRGGADKPWASQSFVRCDAQPVTR